MTKHAHMPMEYKNAPDSVLAELKTAFSTHNTTVLQRLDALDKEQKATDELLDKIQKKMGRPVNAGAGHGGGDLEAEYKAVGLFVKTGDEAEFKNYATNDDPAGGYIVMPERSKIIAQRLYDKSPVRRLSRIISLQSGDAWQEPLDLGDVGATWVGETAPRPETGNTNLGLLTIALHETYALQPVSQKLLDTSFANVGEWLDGKIADKFARSEGSAFLTGDGVLKPKGLLAYDTAATSDATRPWFTLQTVNSGHASQATADGLRDLFWTLKSAYRNNASWLMSSATANAIDKLKDDQNNYLWRDGMTAGAPPTLLGRPVEFDENMPAIGAGTHPIAFGDFRAGYTVVDRLGMRALRDPYSDKPNVVFYAYRRVGGGLANSEAIKLLKISA